MSEEKFQKLERIVKNILEGKKRRNECLICHYCCREFLKCVTIDCDGNSACNACIDLLKGDIFAQVTCC